MSDLMPGRNLQWRRVPGRKSRFEYLGLDGRWHPGEPPAGSDVRPPRRLRWRDRPWFWVALVLAVVAGVVVYVEAQHGGGASRSTQVTLPTVPSGSTSSSPGGATSTSGAVTTTTVPVNSWSVVATTAAPLDALSCPDADYCIGVGGGSGAGAAAVTTDAGKSWFALSVPSGTPQLEAVWCSSETTCVAVGGTSALVTDDGGRTWLPGRVAGLAAGTLRAVSCSSGAHCLAVADVQSPSGHGCPASGAVFVSSNGGATWAQEATLVCEAPTALACSSASACVAAVSAPSGSTNGPMRGALLLTTDGGATWKTTFSQLGAGPQAGTLPTLTAVFCPTATVCEAVGRSVGWAFVQSVDGGQTWNRQTGDVARATRSWDALACVSVALCEAVGPTVPVHLAAIGRWRKSPAPVGAGPLLGLACPSADRCLAVGKAPTGTGGVVVAARPGV